jgi:hypothetical protein
VTGVAHRLTLLAREPQEEAASAAMAGVVREILGSPFHPAAVRSVWLECNHGAARKIAEHIDRTGAFDELPVLADALEDAGCDDPAVLAHCRDPHPHVPGCWVLDAVLGRG